MTYKVSKTSLNDVLILEPQIFMDSRGFFFESFNQNDFNTAIGQETLFVQDNHSKSKASVLRGLHYQIDKPQGKLVRVISGEVFDVVVDLRRSSPTFGKSLGIYLSSENKMQLWIPPGFAHGFYTIGSNCEFLYKTTDYWSQGGERTLLWNDPDLNISWPISDSPSIAPKDQVGINFKDCEYF